MSSITLSLFLCSAILLLCLPDSLDAMPTVFRKHLDVIEDADGGEISNDTTNPQFARPDENSAADLQRNSARLHRTLFMLDTTDILKNARLFSQKTKGRTTNQRQRRDTSKTKIEKSGVVHVIKVRKPTMSVVEDTPRDTVNQWSPTFTFHPNLTTPLLDSQ